MKVKDVESQIVDMIKRLMNGEGYTSKFSAIQIIPTVYLHVSSGNQHELLR
jgi:xanthosine utilization system XapX-like protein